MEIGFSDRTCCSVYPGEYIPLIKAEELAEELKKQREGTAVQPLINIREKADCFHIDLAIPGLKREDFFITVNDNILSIAVLHKECGKIRQNSFQLHEFNYECFNRHIILPENADAEFVSAEYKEGVLRLYVPKADRPAKNPHARIVVY
jgi:HSP20 family protein